MSMSVYRELLRTPGTTSVFIASFFARIPMLALPLALTLLVVEGLGHNYTEAGVVAAVETLGVAFGAPWRGRRIDELGLRRAILPSIIAVAIIYPAMSVASYVMLLPLAFLAGIFLIPIYSIVRLSLAVLVPEERRRSAFSFDAIVAEAAFIIGPAAAGILVIHVSPQIAVVVVGLSTIVAGGLFWVLNPPTRTASGHVRDPEPIAVPEVSGKSWVTRDLWFLYLVSGGAMVTLLATDLSIIAELREQDALGWLWIAYLGWGLSSLIGGALYGARQSPVRPSHLLLVMSIATIPIGLAHSPWALALAVIPAGLLCAPVMAAASEWITHLVAEDRRGEAMGWHGTAFTVGGSIAGPLIGFSIDHSGAWGGFAVGGAVGAAIAVASLMAQSGGQGRKNPSTTSSPTVEA